MSGYKSTSSCFYLWLECLSSCVEVQSCTLVNPWFYLTILPSVLFLKLRFVLAKFEEIFVKHARTNANALTSDELMTMLKSNRVPKDYAGWFVVILIQICSSLFCMSVFRTCLTA